jgi:hypothetical protein
VRSLLDAAQTWPGAALQIVTLNAPKSGSLPPQIQLHLAAD